MTRIIHLDEHVSRVQSSVLDLLDSPNCNLLILSDLQVAVLAQMTFPYARWSTRLIEDHEYHQVVVEQPQAYRDELECLELLLSGGATMTCDLSTVLTELAAAIRASPSGGSGCAGSGPAAILNCVSSMLPEELIPQTPVEAPTLGVPPPGFDTWEEYQIHKCKAAYAIVDAVAGLFGALALAPITITSIAVIQTLLTGYVGGVALGATVFPPATLVAIVAGAIALGLLESAAFMYLAQVQQYILAHKDELACVLYTSGSAAAAQAGIASVVEDAIQSVAWASIFGPVLGGQIAAALGGIAGQAETNNLVNPLFRIVEDFVYPDISCANCVPPCETQTICDFSVDLDGAVLVDPPGGLGYLEWDDTVTPPGASAKTGQLTGHAVVFSGWEMAQNFIVPGGATLEWSQVLSSMVSIVVELEVDLVWVTIVAGDFAYEDAFVRDISAYAGGWCTGIRWTGAKAGGVAWDCHIPAVNIGCV